jgi:hypothetical protein
MEFLHIFKQENYNALYYVSSSLIYILAILILTITLCLVFYLQIFTFHLFLKLLIQKELVRNLHFRVLYE